MFRIVPLLVLVVAVVAIVDIVRSSLTNEKKILWVIIVFFLPVLGAILYYLLGRK